MTHGEFLFDRAIRRHPVIIAPRQIANFRMQRAAHGNIHFLKPAADTKEGLPAFDTGPHQRQGDRITLAVEIPVGFGRLFAILLGVNIRATACQNKAVKPRHQLFDGHKPRICRDNDRNTVRHPRHGLGVHHATGMDCVFVIDQVGVGDNTNQRARHGILVNLIFRENSPLGTGAQTYP